MPLNRAALLQIISRKQPISPEKIATEISGSVYSKREELKSLLRIMELDGDIRKLCFDAVPTHVIPVLKTMMLPSQLWFAPNFNILSWIARTVMDVEAAKTFLGTRLQPSMSYALANMGLMPNEIQKLYDEFVRRH